MSFLLACLGAVALTVALVVAVDATAAVLGVGALMVLAVIGGRKWDRR